MSNAVPPIIPGRGSNPPPPPPLPPAAQKGWWARLNPVPKALLIVGSVVVALCMTPLVLVAAFGAGKAPASNPTHGVTPGGPVVTTAATTDTLPAAPAETTAATTTTVPAPTQAPPTTTTTKAQPPPPPPPPATTPTLEGVTAGAFCSQHYWYGHTSTGKLMQCITTATDSRFRWRAV